MAAVNTTNQQLAFARVQTDAAATAPTTLARRAHWQAGVLQLNMALEAYALELVQLTKQKVPLRPGQGLFSRLADDLRNLGQASAEMDELVRLERDSSSWLTAAQYWAQQPKVIVTDAGQSVRRETTLTELEAQTAGITLVDVGEPRQPFSQEALEGAVNAASELIRRQREQTAEY